MTFRTARAFALLAAFLLISASAGFGAFFAWSTNTKAPILAAFAVAMALGLELAKPLAVHALIDALRAWRFGHAAALAALATVAVSYSLAAELQLMARSRADTIADRKHDTTSATDTRSKRDKLQAQLDKITPARTVAELEPLIAIKTAATKGADCDQWVENSKTRGACLELAQLKAEAGRAAQRAELATKIESAESDLKAGPKEKAADPSATALATYLAALGLHLNPDDLGNWLVLVAVFALEVGSMFAVVLVQAVAPNGAANTPDSVRPDVPAVGGKDAAKAPDRPETQAEERQNTTDERSEHGCSVAAAKLTVADDSAERLVQLVRDRGGEVFGSQRTIGKAIGVSASRLNAILEDLADAGRLDVLATKRGTRVRAVA